jgi:thioredoxin 1
MNKALNKKNFTKEIIEMNGLAIVQFRTEWNGGCQIIAPIYEELSRSYGTSAKFFTIDTEEEKLIAAEYRIMELPTILIFKNGQLIDHVIGLTPKHVLITKIENAITGINN